MFANRYFVGCLAFGLVMLAVGGMAGVVLYANRERFQGDRRSEIPAEKSSQAKEDGGLPVALPQLLTPNRSKLDRIGKHPWWLSPLPPARVDAIIREIFALQPPDGLVVFKTGESLVTGDIYRRRRADEPFGELAGAERYAAPVIHTVRNSLGRPLLSRAQAIAGLMQMLDRAHASEDSFRRTGKGMTNMDGLLQLEWPESAKKEAERPFEELKRQPRPRPAPIVEQQQQK